MFFALQNLNGCWSVVRIDQSKSNEIEKKRTETISGDNDSIDTTWIEKLVNSEYQSITLPFLVGKYLKPQTTGIMYTIPELTPNTMA